jgi:hypothetical protein
MDVCGKINSEMVENPGKVYEKSGLTLVQESIVAYCTI